MRRAYGIIFMIVIILVVAAALLQNRQSAVRRVPHPDGNVIRNQHLIVTGKSVCLPHKNKGEMQTMECAYGVHTDDGKYYALSDPEMKYVPSLRMENHYRFAGILSAPTDNKYDSLGTLTLDSVIEQ